VGVGSVISGQRISCNPRESGELTNRCHDDEGRWNGSLSNNFRMGVWVPRFSRGDGPLCGGWARLRGKTTVCFAAAGRPPISRGGNDALCERAMRSPLCVSDVIAAMVTLALDQASKLWLLYGLQTSAHRGHGEGDFVFRSGCWPVEYRDQLRWFQTTMPPPRSR